MSKDKNDNLAILMSTTALIISIFVFFAACVSENQMIVNVSLILGFVGALSTLVVINNISQVQEVKREFKREVATLRLENAAASKKLEEDNDIKMSKSRCLLSLRAASAQAKVHNYNPNTVLDYISYAIQDYLDVEKDGKALLDEIINQVNQFYNNGSFSLKVTEKGTIDYFLEEFKKLNKDTRASILIAKIEAKMKETSEHPDSDKPHEQNKL